MDLLDESEDLHSEVNPKELRVKEGRVQVPKVRRDFVETPPPPSRLSSPPEDCTHGSFWGRRDGVSEVGVRVLPGILGG